MTASSLTRAVRFILMLGPLKSRRRSVPGKTSQADMNHRSSNGHKAWMPRGVDGSTASQSSSMCVAQAPAHMHAMRVTGRRALAASTPATAATTATETKLCVIERWNPNQQIEVRGEREGGAGEREAASRPGRTTGPLGSRSPGAVSGKQIGGPGDRDSR